LGDGTWIDRYLPGDVGGLASGVRGIHAGHLHTCALTATTGIKCWGNNDSGQLGMNPGWTPVNVVGFEPAPVSITHIEVTQGIQCLDNRQCFGNPDTNQAAAGLYDQYCGLDNPKCDNAVPLFAGRSTLIRVYVNCTDNCDTLASDAHLQGI
jgi:hypothetical protein